MVIDTSALLAMLQREPEADLFSKTIKGESLRLVSAVSVLEAGLVMTGRRGQSVDLWDLLKDVEAQIIPFDADQTRVALDAFARFGKGRHPAGLNFGDCAAYALAKSRAQSLLFKGNDFSQTDISPALPPSP